MTAGVGLFGTFTAYVASWFAAGNKTKNDRTTIEKKKVVEIND